MHLISLNQNFKKCRNNVLDHELENSGKFNHSHYSLTKILGHHILINITTLLEKQNHISKQLVESKSSTNLNHKAKQTKQRIYKNQRKNVSRLNKIVLKSLLQGVILLKPDHLNKVIKVLVIYFPCYGICLPYSF